MISGRYEYKGKYTVVSDCCKQMQKEARMAIEEGKTAPAFTLPDQNGNKVSLKDFRGKNVILYFYPKDNTSG